MEEKKPVKETIEKIAKEFEKAGATKWDLLKIIQKLEEQQEPSKTLKKNALNMLNEYNPKAAQVFLSFQKMKVFTSKEKLEAFDRGNITKSLLKETQVSRSLAEKISSEVEDKLKDLNLTTLTTAMIRDMVAVKLLEYGQVKTYYQYARIGLPVFDVEEKKQNFDHEIQRQYNWLKKIPAKAKELHFKEKILLEAPQAYSSFPICNCIEPQQLKDKTWQVLIHIQDEFIKKKQASHLNPPICSVNIFFAKALEKKTKNNTIRAAKNAFEQLNLLYADNEKYKPVVSLDLSNTSELELKQSQKEKSLEFAKYFAQIYSSANEKNFELAAGIDSKYKLKLLSELNQEITLLNCSNEKTYPFMQGYAGKTSQLSQIVFVNAHKILEDKKNGMERLIYACKTTQELFDDKEKKDSNKKSENIAALNFTKKTFTQNPKENLEDFLTEIKNCFKENTIVFHANETKWTAQVHEKDLLENEEKKIFLKNNIQANCSAKTLDEVEEIFSKKAYACKYLGKSQ